MWDEPYLEPCCRSALHRLFLSSEAGRPEGLKDDPCLRRLMGMGLADTAPGRRFVITKTGRMRHGTEIGARR